MKNKAGWNWLLAWGLGLAAGAAKFGPGFLVQHFLCPLFWMGGALSLLALFCLWKGYVPMKSGDKVYRDKQPKEFRQNVRVMWAFSGFLYLFNFVIAWAVLSRSLR